MPQTPKCVACGFEIKFFEVEEKYEVYKCKCGLSDHKKPVVI